MKKVGKTIRPFRYDLNQTPYNYTVEVTNRFKGLDMIDRVPDEQWTEVRDIVEETGEWRNGTLLASRVVHGMTGLLSSCDFAVHLKLIQHCKSAILPPTLRKEVYSWTSDGGKIRSTGGFIR